MRAASASCARIHDDAELAPRDVVARAVYREVVERPRRLPRLPSAWADTSPSISPPCSPPAARPASIPRASRSRSRRRRITTWAASSPTRAGAAPSTGCGPAARSPRPARMARTGLPPTRCSRRWCSAPASPRTSLPCCPPLRPRAWRRSEIEASATRRENENGRAHASPHHGGGGRRHPRRALADEGAGDDRRART